MRSKKERRLELRVERRVNSSFNKESKRLEDGFAVVEVRTGVTLRWAGSEREAGRMREKMLKGEL